MPIQQSLANTESDVDAEFWLLFLPDFLSIFTVQSAKSEMTISLSKYFVYKYLSVNIHPKYHK